MTTLSPTKARANLTHWLKRASAGEDIGILCGDKVIALRAVRVFAEDSDYAKREYGVTDAELRTFTGADLGFFPIDDHAAALREDIAQLASTPFLTPLNIIAGFIYDVESGEIDDLVRWERT